MTDEAISIVASMISIAVFSIYYFVTHFNQIMKKIEIKMKLQKVIKMFSVVLLVVVIASLFVSFGVLIFGDIDQLV